MAKPASVPKAIANSDSIRKKPTVIFDRGSINQVRLIPHKSRSANWAIIVAFVRPSQQSPTSTWRPR